MIDDIARRASTSLREATSADPDAGLHRVYAAHTRHRTANVLVAAAAVLVALGVGWWGGRLLTGPDVTSPSPAPAPSPSTNATSRCAQPRVSCLGGRTYEFRLEAPVRWHIPSTFEVDSGAGTSSLGVDSYRKAEPTAGVSVLERVRSAAPGGTGPAPGVADTPHAFVEWVASRPFLHAGPVTRTRLDGRTAWQVEVTSKPAPGATECNGHTCHLITFQNGGGTSGIWGGMAARYTALHVPGGGTTIVWSWAFTHDTGDLPALDQAVRGLSWPTS